MGRVLRIGAGLALALLISTCRDERVSGPPRPGALAFDLHGLLTPPAPGQPDIPIDSIRVTLQRLTETTYAYDSTFRVRGDTMGDSLTLTLDVVLNTSPEDMVLDVTTYGQNIQWYSAGGPVTLTAGQTVAGRFIATYVGPGANAASVKILPADTTAVGGLPIALHAVVYDASNQPIAGVPVGYLARTAAVGSVSVNYLTATFTGASAVRDSVWVVAETPTHLKDSTWVHVLPPPLQLQKVSGDGQTGGVGAALLPDSVRVLDALGAPFPGDTITWSVVSGAATLSAGTSVTDNLGYAAAIATPTAAGAVSVRATASWYGSALTGSPQTFSATALSNAPAAIAKVSGDGQGDTVTRALPAPFVVRVTNSSATPLPGVKVAWVRQHGSGTLPSNPDTTTTDANGLTQVTYTLGQTAGVDTILATVVNTAISATFQATAVHDVPTQIIKVSGDAQTDTVNRTLALPLRVKVADAYANGAAGERVAWSIFFGTGGLGASALTVDTSVTDVTGNAQTTFKLGSVAGTDTIQAKHVGSSAVTRFAATAVAGGIGQVILDRTNDTIAVLATLQYHDTLKDTTGNVISGTVTWTSTVPAVATVSSLGLATGVAGGLTSIIASAGGHADTAQLYVRGLTTIVVSPADTVITAIGDSLLLAAQGLDNFGVPVGGLVIRYTSATPTVATVNAITGRVHLVGAGNGVVVAKDSASGKQGSATLRVNQVTASVTNLPLLPDSLQVGVGGLGQIVAKALDRNGFPIPGKVFGYSSRTPTIATVSPTGLVTGVTLGRTYVADSVDGFTDSVLVAVVPTPPALIQWAFDSIAIGNGNNVSVAVSLSRPVPVGSTLIIKFASADTFIVKPQTPTLSIGAGGSSGSIVLNGLSAGRANVVASDSSGLGYLPDTMVATVVSTIEFREIGQFSRQTNYYVNQNETHQAQVFLSDPAPAGGLGVTFVYKSGNAVVTPSPAIIPAGQLSADITITGLSAATDSIVPTSGGFVGRFSYVTVAPNNLHISLAYPYNGVLGVGQSFQPYTYITYSMDHPLVFANTLNPAIGTALATDTIPTNANYRYTTLAATAAGKTTYTVSAPGWNSDSATLTFSTPKLGISGSTSIVAGDPSLGYWYTYTEDSLTYNHPVTGFVTVTVRSRDTSIVAVRDSVGQVTPGNSYVQVNSALQAKATAGGDSVWIDATAPGYQPDSMLVRVTKPTLSLSYGAYPYDGRLGVGTLLQNGGYVQIPYVRPDTFWVFFKQSRPRLAGPGLDSVAILKGQTSSSFNVRGDTLGVDSVQVDTVKTKGYVVSGLFVFRVVPFEVAPYNYPSTLYTISAPQLVSAYVRDSVNGYTYPLVAPLTVSLAGGNPAAYTLDSGKVVIPAGSAYSTNGGPRPYDTLRVVGIDSIGSRIVATATGAAKDSSALIRVYPTPLNVNLGYPYSLVGRGLKLEYNYVSLSGGGAPDTVKVAITRYDPTKDSLSADTVLIPKGQASSNYFEIFGKDSTGSDSVVATAVGYVRSRATFNLQPVDLVLSNPGTSHVTTEPPQYVYTYTETRTGYNQKPATPVTFTIASTNPNVIQVDSALTINATFDTGTAKVDTSQTYTYFKVRYAGSGTAQIITSAPGFKTDSTPVITVTGPSLHIGYTNVTLGIGQVIPYQYVYVDNAVGSALVVHLARSDSTLPPASQAFGSSADSVVIPIGNASSPQFSITGQTAGSAQLIARAGGYSQAVATISIGSPQLAANYTNLSQYVGAAPTPIYVYTEDQSPTPTIRQVAAPLVVGDTVNDPSVASTDSAVRTIPALGNSTFMYLTALKKGSANVVFSAAGYKPDTVVVSADTGQLTLYGMPNGLGPGQTSTGDLYVYLPFSVAAPMIVSLNSSNPSVATVPATATIAVNNNYVYIPVTGVGLGTTTITATASVAKAAAPVNVIVSTPKLFATIGATSYAGQKTYLYVYAYDSVGNNRYLAAPLTVSLASSISGHTTFDSSTITIPAGASYAYTGVTFDTAGTYTLTATATGYASSNANTTVTGALVTVSDFQFAPQTVTISAGSYVTWQNNGPSVHTSTSDAALWNTGSISVGQSNYAYFNTPGTYTYHCSIHPTMTGTVIVQ